MNKLTKVIVAIISFFCITFSVKAESIHSIDMDIYIDQNGDAHVTEVWNTTATEKTEYYHAFYNIGDASITDLKVKNEEREFTQTEWDVNGSLSSKAYKYGYNYTNNGVELCFGKSSYTPHTYTMTYTIKSFVMRVEDADIIYWNLLDKITPAPENVSIVMHADHPFLDTLDVWGYGNYGGLAYVADGKIYLSNDHLSSSDYMVALVKFPLNTFNTSVKLDGDFEDWLEKAEEGATHYSDSDDKFAAIIVILFQIVFWLFIVLFIYAINKNKGLKSGSFELDFKEQGKRLPKEVNMFRDLPCGTDLYRAYWIAYNYDLMKKQTDFLGAILLKWLKQKKVRIESKTVGTIFKKEDTVIIFEKSTFENKLEEELFNYMYEASLDGILESKEFERWCSSHYSKILAWFDKMLDVENQILVNEGKLVKTEKTTFKVFKNTVYEVNPSMYEEAVKMKGLKEFFNEFGNMKDKGAIEVMLWEEYLMYAQLFGVAEKVAKEFKKLYPDVITDYSYDSVIFVHTISDSSMASASSAKSRAEAYSSGGGGFSSGGGGGGSFGGGGGGSR